MARLYISDGYVERIGVMPKTYRRYRYGGGFFKKKSFSDEITYSNKEAKQ